jgi:hypothetical protein
VLMSRMVEMYAGYSRSKDTRPVKAQSNFLFSIGSAVVSDKSPYDRARIIGHSCNNVVLTVCVQNGRVESRAGKHEVRAIILFLYAKGETNAEIHGKLVSAYGEDVMNRQHGKMAS